MDAPHLDETDYQVIARLQEDGRRAASVIARDLGISEAAVRARVDRLLEQRAIRITAITNAAELGYVTGDLRLRVPHGRLDEVGKRLTAIPEVDYVMVTTGRQNLIASVVCTDLGRLDDLVEHQIMTIDGVETIDVSVNLRVVKNTLAW